jgi:hypothetical protein
MAVGGNTGGAGGAKNLAKAASHKRKAPAGDVKSSGGDYGLKAAKKFKGTKQFKRDQQAAGKAAMAKALADAAHAKSLKHVESKGSTLGTVLATAKLASKVGRGPIGLAMDKLEQPVIKTLGNAAIVTAEHPAAMSAHTAKGLRDSVLNIPGGLAQVATQSPVKTGKQIAADYAKRYGESSAEQRKRFAKEGLAPELLDATALAGGTGAATGRALGVAAKAGKLGAKAERIATEARPALRTTGGTAKPQALSPNLFKATGQKALDAKRATKDAEAAAKAKPEVDSRIKSHVAEAARNNETAGRVVEVTPLKGASKAQRTAIAKLKSRGVHLLRGEQHHKVEQVAHRALNQLNHHERAAFYAVAEGWAPADAARAVEHLERRKASIKAARPEGTKVRRRVDEVRTIDDLIKHADKAFTPKLAETVRGLREQDVAVGRADPGLRAAQRLLTRYGPQAKHLGLERGVVPPGRTLYHGSPHGPDVILKKGLRASTPTDRPDLNEPHGVYLSHKPTTANVFGRHMYAVDETALRNLADDPSIKGAKYSPDSIPASALRYLGHTGQWDSKLIKQIEKEASRPPAPRYGEEGVGAFIKRVQSEADKHGLERPLYFPHEADSLDTNPDFASRAVGGAKAVNAPFKRTYTLFNEGRRDTSPDVYLTGLARSIKRKHNWNLVADQFDRSTFKGLRNMPLRQLKAELRARGIDPADVTFWNPGRYRKQLQAGELSAVDKPNRYGDAVSPAEELGVERMQGALADSVRPGTHEIPEELAKSRGWAALPKHAGDEILASAHGENKYVRGVDIARGKSARLMLGLNPAWNVFQVLSNTGLGLAATKGALPMRMAQADRLYRTLTPETKQLVDATVGEGAGSHGNLAKLGASSSGKLTTKYRQAMASPALDKRILGGPPARQLNPIQAGFTFDHYQNGKFRRALLVHSLKQEASKLDDATVKAMLKDPAKAEAHAKLMTDWLGDYTTYTARERKSLVRYPMFYGYLRHSTKLLFKTLPADHPLLLTAALELGQLQHSELKALGLDSLPWADGKFYYTSGGKVHEVPLGRANPVANSLTSLNSFGQLTSFFPPYAQAIANQIAGKDLYTGKGWDAYGKPGFGKPDSYFAPARGRIFAEDMLGAVSAYRTGEKLTMPGPQGDDSMLFSPRPTEHKDKKLRKQDRQRTAQDRQATAGLGGALRTVMPIIPRVSRDPEIAKSLAAKPKKKHPRRKVNYGFGAGGSSGGGLGVGGSSSSKGGSLGP